MSSYYPAHVMERMRKDSDESIGRLSAWMARVRASHEMYAGTLSDKDKAARIKALTDSYRLGLKEVD